MYRYAYILYVGEVYMCVTSKKVSIRLVGRPIPSEVTSVCVCVCVHTLPLFTNLLWVSSKIQFYEMGVASHSSAL